MQEMCRGEKKKPQQLALLAALASVWTITGVFWRANNPLHSYDSRFSDPMQGQKYRPPVIHRRSEG